MAERNRRALLVKANEPLVIEEQPIHEAPANGVVVKTHYAGVCHSDVHIWEDSIKRNETEELKLSAFYDFPIVLGHEISGEIYSIGDQVERDDLKVGDLVLCYAWLGCKNCDVCRAGDQRMCAVAGKHFMGVSNNEGGYQQFVPVGDASDVLKLAPDFPMDIGALVGCSGLTAYNGVATAKPAIQKAVKIHGSAMLMIIGAGGLGMWGITIAKAIMPPQCTVVCVDITDEKVAIGMQAGADKSLVWPLKATAEEIEARTGQISPGGFHAVVDFVNNPTTIGRGVKFLAKGGSLSQVGLFGGCAREVALGDLPLKAVNIHGILVGDIGQLQNVVNLVQAKRIKSPPIIKIKLEEAFEYILRLRDGKVDGRAVIDFRN